MKESCRRDDNGKSVPLNFYSTAAAAPPMYLPAGGTAMFAPYYPGGYSPQPQQYNRWAASPPPLALSQTPATCYTVRFPAVPGGAAPRILQTAEPTPEQPADALERPESSSEQLPPAATPVFRRRPSIVLAEDRTGPLPTISAAWGPNEESLISRSMLDGSCFLSNLFNFFMPRRPRCQCNRS